MKEVQKGATLKRGMSRLPGVILERLAKHFGITEIYAFGSRAGEIVARVRGESLAPGFSGSDVDIAVQPEPGRYLSVQEKVKFAIELEDLLDVPRVDLVVIPEVDPFLASEIIRGELLYCRDRDKQAENELYILARAGDLARYEQERLDEILLGADR
jgi:uncharacterized protein